MSLNRHSLASGRRWWVLRKDTYMSIRNEHSTLPTTGPRVVCNWFCLLPLYHYLMTTLTEVVLHCRSKKGFRPSRVCFSDGVKVSWGTTNLPATEEVWQGSSSRHLDGAQWTSRSRGDTPVRSIEACPTTLFGLGSFTLKEFNVTTVDLT